MGQDPREKGQGAGVPTGKRAKPSAVMVPGLAGVPEPGAGQEQGFVPRTEQLHRFPRSRCQGLGINRLQAGEM